MLPPPVALPLPLPEKLSIIQAHFLDAEVSTGASKGKKVQPLVKTKDSEDTLTIKDVISKAKDVDLSPKLGILNPRQLTPRKTLTQQRPSYRDVFSYLSAYIFLLLWCFHH